MQLQQTETSAKLTTSIVTMTPIAESKAFAHTRYIIVYVTSTATTPTRPATASLSAPFAALAVATLALLRLLLHRVDKARGGGGGIVVKTLNYASRAAAAEARSLLGPPSRLDRAHSAASAEHVASIMHLWHGRHLWSHRVHPWR